MKVLRTTVILLPSIILHFTHSFHVRPPFLTQSSNYFTTSPPLPYPNPQLTQTSPKTKIILHGWGPEPVWSPCDVLSLTNLNSNVKKITIDYGDRKSEFTNGGQYVQVKSKVDKDGENVGYYALSCPPTQSSGSVDLIVRSTASNSHMFADGVLDVSQVMGGGFDGGRVEGCERIIVACTGTGIGPCYSYLVAGAGGFQGDIVVYWGTRDESWGGDIVEELEGLGAKVNRVISGVEGGCYVQDVIEFGDVERTGVMVVGQKEMFQDVKEKAIKAGVEEGRIFSNF
mmetsp:Transcript_4697/g.9435  ORF Transcript_4697/g.9435 Transcript_4697/m.9435 type:complete len:285 (+) Transcript_4697:89-943(+)